MVRRPKIMRVYRNGTKEEEPENPYHHALGFFALRFNRLEGRLASAITMLMLPSSSLHAEINAVVLGQIRSVDDRIRLFRHLSITRYRGQKPSRQCNLAANRFQKINNFRNDLFHGEWRSFSEVPGDPEALRALVIRFQSFLPKDVKWKTPDVSLEEIYRVSRQTIRFERWLFLFTGAVYKENLALIAQSKVHPPEGGRH